MQYFNQIIFFTGNNSIKKVMSVVLLIYVD